VSYKVYLWGTLDAIEWSQAVWKIDGRTVPLHECRRELLHDVMLPYLPKDGLIVDAGCGTARWPIYLQRMGYRIFGIEINHDAGVIAKENEASVSIVQGDIRRFPLKPASVDAVLSLGVVEHDEAGPEDALRETRRILKPNGLLILVVPYDNLFRRLVANPMHRRVTRQRRRSGAELRFGEYRFTGAEVRRFLKRTGFAVVATYPNDVLPPKNVGLWVDLNNLTYSPFAPPPTELFVLTGLKGRIAELLMRWVPWAVCGEVTFVARAV
jgi:SAM-dependent methyltransferase